MSKNVNKEPRRDAKNFFAVMIQNDDKTFLMLHKDYSVAAWMSEYDAMQYFEKPYREAHTHTYERSMSACIHWLTFKPRVVHFNSIEEVEKILVKPMRPATIHNVSGWMTVLECNELATAKYEEGREPSLI